MITWKSNLAEPLLSASVSSISTPGSRKSGYGESWKLKVTW
nr:hypothetical protein [uncultured bacterium]